jgi:hypothetical protein
MAAKKRIDLSTKSGMDRLVKQCVDGFKEAKMFDSLNLSEIYEIKNGRWSDTPIAPENIKPGMMIVVNCDITEMQEYKGQRYGREEGPHEIYVENVGYDPITGTLSIMSDEFFISTQDIWEHIKAGEIADMHMMMSSDFHQNLEDVLRDMMEIDTQHQQTNHEFETQQDMQMAYATYGCEYETHSLPSSNEDIAIGIERT